jgi:beta-lactamase regulating signal transducer with metallopeptidase domain
MNNPFGPLLVSPIASLAWTILWQSTLWLALGLVISRLWRGRAARAHLLLVLATVAAVASPLLTVGVRGLGWGFLPAPRSTEGAEVRLEATPPVAAPQSPVVEQPEIPVAESTPEQMEPAASNLVERSALPPTVSSDSTPETVPPTEATPAWTTHVGSVLPAAFIAAWILCSLGLAIRVTTSMLAGRGLVRRSVREEHPGLLAALGEARRSLGVRADVSLHVSSAARCPMIWCWGWRPVLLVPPSASQQSCISWCSVFCHELAHWLRRDHLSSLWTELLVIAIPWQPLVWLSRRQLSALREQACDDWVLATIREATDYAESLVHLVPQNSPTFALPALRSYESLKRRLEHVLAGVRVTPRAGRNWIALASLVSLVAAAGIAFAQQRSQATNAKADAETPPASTTSADQSNDIKLLPAREENGDDFTVRGRVLKPDGQPAAGARLSIVRYFFGYLGGPTTALVTAATAQPDGRFTLTYHPSQMIGGIGRVEQWRETMVVAEADGCGLQWADWQDIVPDKPLLMKLTVDAPIHGRVMDLEGRPIEGVAVSIQVIRGAENGTSIDPWLNAVKSGADAPTAWRAAKLTLLPYYEDGSRPPVKTGPDGRFVLSGVGPDRIVDLALNGDTIAHTTFTAVTRAMAPVTRQFNLGVSPMKGVVLGSDFTYPVPPSRLITGTVQDAATGKALAGVTVAGNRGVASRTDAQGRYRLMGLPKGKGNEITAFPNDDQPYLMRAMVVPDSPGAGPVSVDFELHRGIWIEGRVFEKETGKPALARMHYLPFLNNPFTRGLPEFNAPNVDGNQFRYATKPDGSFRLVGLPGRAIVGAEAVAVSYKLGVGASQIKGAEKNGGFRTYLNPITPGLKWPNAIKEINPPKEATTVRCDLALERGETIRVTLVDRQSKPVSGCTVTGRANRDNYAPVPQATFDLENLSLGETRPILIEQKERAIGKFLLLKFDEKSPRTMSITLEPCATLVGRILDEEGVPLGGTHLVAHPYSGRDFWLRLSSVVCNADGTFKYTGLVPGCDYAVQAEGTQMDLKVIAKRLKVEPGELIDLGDIRFKRNSDEAVTTEPRRKAAQASGGKIGPLPSKVENGDLLTIRGQVVSQDGRPIAGVKLSIVGFVNGTSGGENPARAADKRRLNRFTRLITRKSVPIAVTRSRENGMFEIAYRKSQIASDNNWRYAPLIAEADGFGANEWTTWTRVDAAKPVVLELAPDVPVKGRVVDLEGKPVAGVRIENVRVSAPSRGESLDPWIEALKMGRDLGSTSQMVAKSVPWYRMDSQGPTTTDKDGRFQLRGIGPERVVDFHLRGETIVYAELTVATRNMEPLTHPLGLYSSDEKTPLMRQVYGSEFTFQATPTQPIMGTVHDAATGKPLAGVGIASDLPLPGNDGGRCASDRDRRRRPLQARRLAQSLQRHAPRPDPFECRPECRPTLFSAQSRSAADGRTGAGHGRHRAARRHLD